MAHIGFLVYPGVIQLDVMAPYQILSFPPDTTVYLIWKSRDPIASNEGLAIVPTTTLEACPPLDIICVPGGSTTIRRIKRHEASTTPFKKGKIPFLNVKTGKIPVLTTLLRLDTLTNTGLVPFYSEFPLVSIVIASEGPVDLGGSVLGHVCCLIPGLKPATIPQRDECDQPRPSAPRSQKSDPQNLLCR